jgi:hypothetical protein
MNDNQYITKKEFYTAAALILFLIESVIIAIRVEGGFRLYLFFVTIAMQLYYCYKVAKIRVHSKQQE